MMLHFSSAIVVTSLLLVACSGETPPSFGDPKPLSVPAGDNASGPRLAQMFDEDGADSITLSWMERDDDNTTLKFTNLSLDKWQSALTVTKDPDMFVNWADLPAVTPLASGRLFAHWLSYRADAPYAYDVLTSQSSDQGNTWSAPVRPHTDGTESEHGFVSVYPAGRDAGLIWLDGRKTVNQVGDDPVTSGMTLRGATVGGDGVYNESELDELVCDCCQTDIAIGEDGPIAVYRDRSVDEIRDVYVSRQIEGQWQTGIAVANDGWRIEGCPVNGPSIAAHGDQVGVAWFTGANGNAIVKAAVSRNGGKSFSDPIEIASRKTSGRVGIAIVDERSFAVSWLDEGRDDSFDINIRALTIDGHTGDVHTVGRTSVPFAVPQLVRAADKLILAWTDEISESSKVASVAVPILGFYD